MVSILKTLLVGALALMGGARGAATPGGTCALAAPAHPAPTHAERCSGTGAWVCPDDRPFWGWAAAAGQCCRTWDDGGCGPAEPRDAVCAPPRELIAARARVTYYNPANNDPPGSRACAFSGQCTSPTQGSPSSAARALHGPSPYERGAQYLIVPDDGSKPLCVRIDDECAGCHDSHIDVFLEDGDTLPYDYGAIYRGC